MTAVARSAERWKSSDETDQQSGQRVLGVKPPTRWEELTPGLMVFFARPSLLQSCVERWGQEWRHVGITVQTPEGLRVACYSAKRLYRIDDLEVLMPSYDRVGVASIGATPAEVEAISTWCASFDGLTKKEAPYSKRPFAFGPMLPMAQRKTGILRTVLFAVLLLYCCFEQRLLKRRPSFMCSTFVLQAIRENTASNLRVPISAHPDDQAAYATPTTGRDELLARWFCSPTDLWNAVSDAHRSELELDHLVDRPAEVEVIAEVTAEPDRPANFRAAVTQMRAAFVVVSLLFLNRLR